jgi:hypothetical protein
VKAGRGPFSQFKQLPLITPLIGGRGRRGWWEVHRGGASGAEAEQEHVAFGLGAQGQKGIWQDPEATHHRPGRLKAGKK